MSEISEQIASQMLSEAFPILNDSGIIHRGEYNPATQYIKNNVTTYLGSSYMVTVPCVGVVPTNTSNWQLLASKGDRGVVFQWRDQYSTSTTYEINDSVVDASRRNIYYSLVTNNTNNPLTDATKWAVLMTVNDLVSQVNTAVDSANTVNTNITNAENLRVTAEGNRVSSENSRSSAESSRATAETSRSDSESTRTGSESTRQLSENTRVSQETARQTAMNNLVHLGAWSSATAYQVRNVVSLNGSSYMCIAAHTNQSPPSATYWQLVGLKGIDGTGTVTSLASSNSDVVIAGTAQVPDLSVNSGVGANQFPKRDANGNLQNIGYATTNVSANTTLTLSQSGIINVTTGATDKTITLPDATTAQVVFTIKKVDSGAGHVVINTTSSQIIDGSATKTLINQFSVITVVSSGGQWWVDVDNDSDKIGILSGLLTNSKSDLVSAINENKTNITTNTTDIGTKTNLTTNSKTDLVSAINETNINRVFSKSASATLLTTETGVIDVTTSASTITITLPTAATVGLRYTIKKGDSGTGTVTINTTSSQTIDGSTSRIIYNQFDLLTVVSNGTTWDIVGRINKGEQWIAPTLQNSWINFGGTNATAGYYKDDSSIVHMRGLIKSGTTTAGTLLFTLPPGYRPSFDDIKILGSNNGTAFVPIAVTVAASGNVSIGSFPPGSQWLSLDFTFRAEQ